MGAAPSHRPRFALALLVALAGTLPAVAALAQPPAKPARAPALTREQMEAGLAGAPAFRFVYGTLDAAATPRLRERALLIARRLFGADSSRVEADREATQAELSASSVLLIGSPRENDWTRRLAPDLPVSFGAGSFRWQATEYARPGDAIVIAWPNPLAPKHFLLVVAGNSIEATAGQRAWLPGGEDWRITRDGDLARSGRFAQSAAAPWRYDAALDRDLEAERARYVASLVAKGPAPLVVRAPASLAVAAPARAAGVALLARLDAFGLTAPPRSAPVSLTLYRSLEQKGLMSRDTRPEHLETGAAHAALPAGREALDLWSVAAARLVASGATARSRFLEPASVLFAGRFEGEPFDRALARVYYGRVLPSAAEAATRDEEFRSPLIRIPARALLARAMFECAGSRRNALLSLLRADPPGTLDSLCRAARVDADAVTARYRLLADSLAREGRASLANSRPRPWRPADGFQRGVCLAHNVSLEHGYLSAEATRELKTLRDAGAAWVSLTPFGYLPDRRTPVMYSSARGGPDEETDEAVCESAARAKVLGLRVWLAPHLWTRGWVGDLEYSAEDWPRFFERYREFVLHWALLAERERIDGLVMGHELASSTARHPERWRALIADVRAVYTGTLTYEANWDEVARVPFWDALDLIGVSFFFPLADGPPFDPPTLRAGAKKAFETLAPLAKRFGRPVLLGEVGYPASPTAPVRPWEEGGRTIDAELQRDCYDAVVEALDPRDWVAGAFWWKWYTSFSGERADEMSYSPRGRPAEEAMRASLARWVQRPVRVPR